MGGKPVLADCSHEAAVKLVQMSVDLGLVVSASVTGHIMFHSLQGMKLV